MKVLFFLWSVRRLSWNDFESDVPVSPLCGTAEKLLLLCDLVPMFFSCSNETWQHLTNNNAGTRVLLSSFQTNLNALSLLFIGYQRLFYTDGKPEVPYSICPIINGLSDHDAQSITLHSFYLRPPPKKMYINWEDKHTINDFLIKLSYETRDTIFPTGDVNKMFNSFLDSYLKICYSSFLLKTVHIAKKIKIGLL